MEIMRSNVRTFVEQQQFSFETLWNKAVQSEQTQERIFRCCKNRFQYFANGIEKNNNKKNVFLYEYLSDKLERNDNRGIAKEQLKFNFTSSVPSTDNKKLNRCLDILVNGYKENICQLLYDLLDNANKFTVARTISIVMNVIDIGNNDNKCVIVSIKD
jgi:hypothetical protein